MFAYTTIVLLLKLLQDLSFDYRKINVLQQIDTETEFLSKTIVAISLATVYDTHRYMKEDFFTRKLHTFSFLTTATTQLCFSSRL